MLTQSHCLRARECAALAEQSWVTPVTYPLLLVKNAKKKMMCFDAVQKNCISDMIQLFVQGCVIGQLPFNWVISWAENFPVDKFIRVSMKMQWVMWKNSSSSFQWLKRQLFRPVVVVVVVDQNVEHLGVWCVFSGNNLAIIVFSCFCRREVVEGQTEESEMDKEDDDDHYFPRSTTRAWRRGSFHTNCEGN